MSDVLSASIKEKLWHAMRADLEQLLPQSASQNLLMCPACGRMLHFEDFSLEHLIPQQAVKRDPVAVRTNPMTPVNLRSGTLLLCQKPLYVNGRKVNAAGCNVCVRPRPLVWIYELGRRSGSWGDGPRHEFIDPVDRMSVGDAGQGIGEVSLGVEAVQFGGLQNGDHGSGAMAALIATGE